MTKSDHRKPINFVGVYFIDEHVKTIKPASHRAN